MRTDNGGDQMCAATLGVSSSSVEIVGAGKRPVGPTVAKKSEALLTLLHTPVGVILLYSKDMNFVDLK